MRTATMISLLIVLGCGPIEITPGFRLGGSAAAAPESFAFVHEHEVIQLEAQGSLLPHVVNIWGVGLDDALYVWGDAESGWVRRVAERPDEVRVRIADNAYELSATKVTDASDRQRVVASYQAKYGESLDEVFGRPVTVDDFELIYRLTPRN